MAAELRLDDHPHGETMADLQTGTTTPVYFPVGMQRAESRAGGVTGIETPYSAKFLRYFGCNWTGDQCQESRLICLSNEHQRFGMIGKRKAFRLNRNATEM